MEDLKNSNDFNDKNPNIKRSKGSKHQRQMRLDINPNIKSKHQVWNVEV